MLQGEPDFCNQARRHPQGRQSDLISCKRLGRRSQGLLLVHVTDVTHTPVIGGSTANHLMRDRFRDSAAGWPVTRPECDSMALSPFERSRVAADASAWPAPAVMADE
jgi:hypothetical protein